MTALQLNAEIYSDMSIIAKDESMLAKVAKYVRKLAMQMTNDPTQMSKEEFYAMVEEAREEARQGRVKRMLPNETLDDFLKRVS